MQKCPFKPVVSEVLCCSVFCRRGQRIDVQQLIILYVPTTSVQWLPSLWKGPIRVENSPNLLYAACKNILCIRDFLLVAT